MPLLVVKMAMRAVINVFILKLGALLAVFRVCIGWYYSGGSHFIGDFRLLMVGSNGFYKNV